MFCNEQIVRLEIIYLLEIRGMRNHFCRIWDQSAYFRGKHVLMKLGSRMSC